MAPRASCVCVSQEITRLHSSRLADVRIPEFNLGNMLSLHSKLCPVSLQSPSSHPPPPPPRPAWRHPLFSTSRRRQPELFSSSATMPRKERGIFIYRSLSVAKLLEHRARRGNTEYHRQTLISCRRGQIVPSRSNFRESSRALDRAATRRARIRAVATSRRWLERGRYVKVTRER